MIFFHLISTYTETKRPVRFLRELRGADQFKAGGYMKKIILPVLLLCAAAAISAQGIGIQGGPAIGIMDNGTTEASFAEDVAITFRFTETSPFVFGLSESNGLKRFAVFADFWLINKPLTETFNLYAGAGAYAGAAISPFRFSVGGRIPIGVNAFFLNDFIEPYAQIVPSAGFAFGSGGGLQVSIPVNIGIRFWIKNKPDFNGIKAKYTGAVQAGNAAAMQAAFNQVFAAAFYVGGLYPDYYTALAEGQGISWKQKQYDANETNETASEIALLKKVDGADSWWYLRYQVDGESLEFEALIDTQLRVKKIRYYDSETKDIEEYVFPVPSSPTESSGAYAQSAALMGLPADFAAIKEYSQGTEKVSVPAGSWNAEKLVYEYGSSKERISFKWWISPDVPGELLKYEYRYGNESSADGSLVSVKSGYKTKFSSY